MLLPYNHAARRPHGYAFHHTDDGQMVEGDTLQCVHCQGHRFVAEWRANDSPMCRTCMGPLCGDADCLSRCEHWANELERLEKAATRHLRGY